MNEQPAAGPSTNTPRWQAGIAALSLILLTTVVLLPMALLALGVWGLVLGVASAWSLDAVGVRGASLKEAVAVAVVLFAAAGLVTMVEATIAGLMKLDAWRQSKWGKPGQPRVAFSPPKGPTNWRSVWYDHPWFSLAGVALLVDGCVAPFHASKAIHLPPELLGGFILTGAALLFLFVVGYSLRLSFTWMRSLWLGVRQSPFFAGLVTAGCLVVSGTVLLIGHAFGQVASALSVPQTARALEACSGSADCSRRVLQSALDGQPRAPASLPVGAYTPEQRTSFEQCVEELRAPEKGGWSTIDRAVFEASSIISDKAQVEDLVQGALLTVCLMPERIYAIKPYFIKSVKNAAYTQWRKDKRTCPVIIEEPTWLIDRCVSRSVEQQLIQFEAETAAQQALCSLSHDERRLIVWHVEQNLSHAQIAAKLGISETTARQRYSRALAALREKFSQKCQ